MSDGRKTILMIAGEASGDTLGAELIDAIRRQPGGDEIDFIGAGGPKMEAAALRPEFDLSEHAVVGIWEVLKNYFKFRRLFRHLFELATRREPDAIVLIDYPGFNLRFAKAIRRHNSQGDGAFREWQPKIVCYVSPQLWAWKEGRVHAIARNIDLMLSIFPFEKEWYAERVPAFAVEFVGHPLVDRFPLAKPDEKSMPLDPDLFTEQPTVLLLPGSRRREIDKHLLVMLEAAVIFSEKIKTRLRMVLPSDEMLALARRHIPTGIEIDLQVGGLAKALGQASIAIASSGTVTMECAWFRVPTVVLYKTSPLTHALGRALLKVPHLAMPNLLAGEELFPEFIQSAANADNLAEASLRLLRDKAERTRILNGLDQVAAQLGEPGAATRAAQAVLGTLD
ncbi:MAG: lipid-A-disaccharide synthase [Verrucomicrobiota bacterium]|jgi:lipid-A-disaccharide synthase|nr:lipid-A-disaccharide synthase [Verrucomicrobiota bacterium]MDP7441633.1 lipid-A-disaccharide synthase [Verrucomicrobiota bacterium]|tara:strand:+ start:8581 stop:9765 length:1185 start_codon:yes stop_codon:yes gene_type:complete